MPEAVDGLNETEVEAWNFTMIWTPPTNKDSVELYLLNVHDENDECRSFVVERNDADWTYEQVCVAKNELAGSNFKCVTTDSKSFRISIRFIDNTNSSSV